MKSEIIGGGILEPEVLNVSPHGFWRLVRDREYFLDFGQFPWFRHATLDQLFTVKLHHDEHLFWPLLDVDLDLNRVEHPDRYPLIAKSPDKT